MLRCWSAMSARRRTPGRIQTNMVRIDGQRSVYIPMLKQGGDSNTITIVNGMKAAIKNLVDIPASLKTAVVFDQSVFVKVRHQESDERGRNRPGAYCAHDSAVPGERARDVRRPAVDSAVCARSFHLHSMGGGSINTMVLAGLALAFSRLIDNSVVVLENIFRHMEMGETPESRPKRAAKRCNWPCWLPPSPPPSCSFRSRFCTESAGISLPRLLCPWSFRSSPPISWR